MRKLATILAIATTLALTGCSEPPPHYMGQESIGTFVSSEGITDEYGNARAKVITTEGTFYVSKLMSARNNEQLWLEEYSNGMRYMCSKSNNKCYALVAR
tara:strand:+ start:88560 stop:88859 length:300 start_codon:yes stop_codon:yes gene_type:complete